MKSFSNIATLMVMSTLLTTACHKTFFNDEVSYGPITPKVEAPTLPNAGQLANEKLKVSDSAMTIDCVFKTSSNIKAQLTLDTKKKTLVSVALYDTGKDETPVATSQKVTKQTSGNKTLNADLADGSNVAMPLSLLKKDQKEDVLVNDQDVYNCN